ncbi:polyprenol phosphomannose-dependent alpha 1,6 mannosyltransferase MptB [Nesterenkonia populi]|uniref:polyprenol phosphomannose-dependent alpha 1,6 mannosyltransferase MptB n=1 Tax=Nesterenkonia populi TaxID=1591087 RepID=UPI0011BE49EF|nr:polyprenol phosphomannose-dependent alpha 1,6 mannosyltransferase MptB [Nesterenkonia populi]
MPEGRFYPKTGPVSTRPEPEAPAGFRITRAANAARRWLSGFVLTRWLIGGPEGQASHTMRQGLLAALMIMVGSWGAGWIPLHAAVAVHPAVLPLRTTDAGAVTSAILLVVGALLLMRSWLRLIQRVDVRSPGAVAAMRRALIMWGTPMLLCLPIFSRDVYSYMAQGRVLHAGLNPYESGVSELPGWFAEGADGLWAESPSPYGPLFLLIAQTVWFATGGSPELGILAFRALAVLGVVLMVIYIPRLAAAFGARPAWAVWLCVLNPLSLIVFLPAAHNDPLMIGLMLAGAWYSLKRKRLAAVLLVTAAVAVKPIAMVVLPFVILLALPDTRSYLLRVREWAFAGSLAGALLVAGGLALGVGLGWFTAALSAGAAVLQGAPVGLLGIGIGELAALVSGLDADAVAVTVYDVARILSAVALAAMLLKPRLGNPVLWSAYGLTVVVLASSVIQPWYVLWILPLYAVVHAYRGRVMTSIIVLITAMVLLSMVGQLSVPQWIDQWVVRGIAAGVAALYLIYLAVFDPSTSRMFTLRDRSERWNAADGWLRLRELSTPDASWRAAELSQEDSEQKAGT